MNAAVEIFYFDKSLLMIMIMPAAVLSCALDLD